MPCFDLLDFFKSPAYSKKSWLSEENQDFGGDGRDRTVDLLNAIQALSQLSYTPEDLSQM